MRPEIVKNSAYAQNEAPKGKKLVSGTQNLGDLLRF